ncbi:hypothetical protein Snas_3481 [Stackebrandtia nassauensis DSM 44728]|uniref:Uncharacterized protein n=2 Tax=Stackebrandtia TaxID=283810 RepID=D3PVN0_STANL|nr:hypothetical protein Snas_3481 [Stackebrandtia nassauensis DSM 44728]
MLAAGGAFAFAETDNAAEASPSPPDSRVVTLPTGDIVSVSPDGGMVWRPAKDREDIGLINPPAHDGSGDVVAIPTDRVDDIKNGKEDPRRYNVSELLRSGVSDAAKASRLSSKPYGTFAPKGDAPKSKSDKDSKVTITITDQSGAVPRDCTVDYVNVADGTSDEIELGTNCKGSVSLPPGQYDFLSWAGGESGDVQGVTTAKVKNSPLDVAIDGTKSKEVTYKVDQAAQLGEQSVKVSMMPEKGDGLIVGVDAPAGRKQFVIPTGKSDHTIGIQATPHLVGTDNANPYTYDLDFYQTDGIPAKPVFTARDGDLAKVTRTFDGLATTEPTNGCNWSYRKGASHFSYCQPREQKWQTQRTEYLTPGKDITWHADTVIGDYASEKYVQASSTSTFKAGPSERVTGQAPLSFNVGGSGTQPLVVRDGDKLYANMPFLDNADSKEYIVDYNSIKGTAVLKRDGKEVARKDLKVSGFELTLPKKDSGRYTLSVKSTHSDSYTPLATKSAVKWEFKSKPTTKPVPLPVSAVAFDAEGVSNGYADVSKPQKFTLDYQAQQGAKDTKLKKLVFEVSYDDGKTWTKVDTKVDGDSATGELKHPADATFVSVRATATDDAGNTVTHSTVHTHGLK